MLEGQLKKSGGTSILPGGISSADIHYEPWMRRPEHVQVSLESYPNIRNWLAVMAEQQQVKYAYQKLKEEAAAVGIFGGPPPSAAAAIK